MGNKVTGAAQINVVLLPGAASAEASKPNRITSSGQVEPPARSGDSLQVLQAASAPDAPPPAAPTSAPSAPTATTPTNRLALEAKRFAEGLHDKTFFLESSSFANMRIADNFVREGRSFGAQGKEKNPERMAKNLTQAVKWFAEIDAPDKSEKSALAWVLDRAKAANELDWLLNNLPEDALAFVPAAYKAD